MFILNLVELVNNIPQNISGWDEAGLVYIIYDLPKFEKELSKYFKTNKIKSFRRQLNYYDFTSSKYSFNHKYFTKKRVVFEKLKRVVTNKPQLEILDPHELECTKNRLLNDEDFLKILEITY